MLYPDDRDLSKRRLGKTPEICLFMDLIFNPSSAIMLNILCVSAAALLESFLGFFILCQAPYHRLSLFKKGCLSCLYCGVIMQTATLIGEQLLYLMF